MFEGLQKKSMFQVTKITNFGIWKPPYAIFLCLVLATLLALLLFMGRELVSANSPYLLDNLGSKTSGFGYFIGRICVIIFYSLSSLTVGFSTLLLAKKHFEITDGVVSFAAAFVLGTFTFSVVSMVFTPAKEYAIFPPIFLLLISLVYIVFNYRKDSLSTRKIEPQSFIIFGKFTAALLINNLLLIIALSGIWLFALDGDVLSHYHQYLIKMRDVGSLGPFDVWYHWFYTKGNAASATYAGIFDLGSKQDISLVHLSALMIIAFSLFKKVGFRAVHVAFGLSIIPLYILATDYGALAKNHIIVAFCIYAQVLFLVAFLSPNLSLARRKLLLLFSLISYLKLLLISPPAVLFIGPLYALLPFFNKEVQTAKVLKYTAYCIVVCSITLATILIWNYVVVGLFEINPMRLFLNFADFAKFGTLFSPYIFTVLDAGSSTDFGKITLDLQQAIGLFIKGTHIDAYVVNFGAIPVFLFSLLGIHNSSAIFRRPLIYFILTSSILALVAIVLVSQPVSVYRATLFAGIPISIILACGAFELVRILGFTKFRFYIATSLVLAIFVQSYYIGIGTHLKRLASYANNSYSVDQYYKDYSLGQGFQRPTAIGVKLKKMAMHDERIVSISLISNRLGRAYLLGNGMKSEISWAFGHDWAEMAFGQPDDAYRALRRHVDYIIIDTERIGISLIGFSELLSPENINSYFKVVLNEDGWLALASIDNPNQGRALTDAELENLSKIRDGAFSGIYNFVKVVYAENGEVRDQLPSINEKQQRPIGWQ